MANHSQKHLMGSRGQVRPSPEVDVHESERPADFKTLLPFALIFE